MEKCQGFEMLEKMLGKQVMNGWLESHFQGSKVRGTRHLSDR